MTVAPMIPIATYTMPGPLNRGCTSAAAISPNAGRVWGNAPLAEENFGLLKDAGFGLRLGNARSGFGNVIHVDLAFPFNGDPSIKRAQFLVQTQQSF